MTIVLLLFSLMGAAMALLGMRLVRNTGGWGDRWVARTQSRSRWGPVRQPATRRLLIGAGYIVTGTVVAVIGLGLLMSLD